MKICPNCKSEYGGGELFCPIDAARLMSPSEAQRSTDDPLVGETLSGRYRVLRRIGEGGMGIVYEAEHVVIERRVAVKVLRNDFSQRSEVVARFRQEAKSASRIGHEHIVDVMDFGETADGQSYFVMEMLVGEDLAHVLEREGRMPIARVAPILYQCCRALAAAHSKGIVHRDMKPENVYLVRREDEPDFVKIVDFGIAKMNDIETVGAPGRKLTKTGMIFGTPEYMSPEQASGASLDHRVDIYALGVILFEAVTGRVPFLGDSFMGVLSKHMFDAPPTLASVCPGEQFSPALEEVVAQALAKEPSARYQSADDLGAAVMAAAGLSLRPRSGFPTLPDAAIPPPVVASVRPVKLEAAPTFPSIKNTRPALDEVFEAPERERSRGLVVIVVAIVALAGVGGVWAVLDRTSAASNVVDESPGSDTPDGAASATTTTSERAGFDGSPASATTPATSAGIQTPAVVHVVSRPSGARIQVIGRAEGCRAAPCPIQLPPHQRYRIEARLGGRSGEMAVDVGGPEERHDVAIDLGRHATKRPGGGTPEESPPTSAPTTGPSLDDLRVPEQLQDEDEPPANP